MESKKTTRRPIAITIVCILGLVGAIVFTGFMPIYKGPFLNSTAKMGKWYLPYLELFTIARLLSILGLWYMKKWGAYMYAVFFLINQLVLIETRTWIFLSFLPSAIIVMITFLYIKEME